MKFAKQFSELVRSRTSVRGFKKDKSIPDEILFEALSLCQRAPSGFNLQPYKAIVVQDALVKKQVAYTMLGGNIKRVLDAPVTVVFLADLKPWKLLNSLSKLEKEKGNMTSRQVDRVVSDAKFLLGGMMSSNDDNDDTSTFSDVLLSKLSIPKQIENFGEASIHTLEQTSKHALLSLLSNVTQSPTMNSSSEAWSFKNTMLAVQTYILAISAFGYQSCPMEGFDARRMKEVLSVPHDRYSIPIVVSSGIVDQDTLLEGGKKEKRPRLDFESIFCKDTFDFPLHTKKKE